MSMRSDLLAALASLPEWTYEMAEAETDRVYADTSVIMVYLPLSEAKWFLAQRHDYDGGRRFFGLCDLGVGFPELGWVDETDLLASYRVPMMRLGTELIGSLSQCVVSPNTYTLGEAYQVCGLDVPEFLVREEDSDVAAEM